MSGLGHTNGPNIVGNYYKVGKKIGEGSFGVIFEGRYRTRTTLSLFTTRFGLSELTPPVQRYKPPELVSGRHQVCASKSLISYSQRR